MIKHDTIHLNDYKLIVFDVDGTLVGKDHVLDPFTKEVLFRLREGGFPFTLATGKNLPGTKPLADELEIELPLVLINGGMLQTRHEEMLSKKTLPLDATRQVIEICEARGKDLVIYIDNGIYVKAMNENIFPVYNNVVSGLFEIDTWDAITNQLADANKCLVVDSFVRKNLIEMGKVFEKTLKGRVDILHSSTYLVEVMPKGVTKATGIRMLADRMEIPMGAVMAFGDFNNDAEMLAEVGLGVAVENASSRAKEAADLVIGSVEEHGPAEFLRELIDR
ncbi:MAG: HAD family hydrolase [Anaerolineaceae bacterium]|nr:HAD family hydrolase [Anaerolineaceae bacterium]